MRSWWPPCQNQSCNKIYYTKIYCNWF